jgi:hypothetical protein
MPRTRKTKTEDKRKEMEPEASGAKASMEYNANALNYDPYPDSEDERKEMEAGVSGGKASMAYNANALNYDPYPDSEDERKEIKAKVSGAEKGKRKWMDLSESDESDTEPLVNLAEVEVANIPVMSSIEEIKLEAMNNKLIRVYFDLKVVYIKKGMELDAEREVIHVYCCGIKRKETKESLKKLKKVLDQPYNELKGSVMRKMVRISIWNSNFMEVNEKIKMLDIIRVRKFSNLHTFNGTPQMNVLLANIDVGVDLQ